MIYYQEDVARPPSRPAVVPSAPVAPTFTPSAHINSHARTAARSPLSGSNGTGEARGSGAAPAVQVVREYYQDVAAARARAPAPALPPQQASFRTSVQPAFSQPPRQAPAQPQSQTPSAFDQGEDLMDLDCDMACQWDSLVPEKTR